MLTVFDKYLLRRFLHTFCVLFVATFGLFIVFDLFTNVDAFQEGAGGGVDLVVRIVRYYGFQACDFFELIGTTLVVISTLIVLAMLQRRSEVHPILAAGIPTYRLAVPFLVGTVFVNGLLIVNQEFLIPGISNQLQAARGSADSHTRKVEPVHDHFNHMMRIDGESILPANRTLRQAMFTLHAPMVREGATLHASEAVYYSHSSRGPGWLLRGAKHNLESISLTEEGRKVVLPTTGDDVFIVSEVSFDQLYNRSGNYKFLSASELVRRIRHPVTGLVPIRSQRMHLHFRVTRPLINIATVLLTIPLIIKRQSRSLVTDVAVCTLILGILYGIMQTSLYLGTASLLAADYAAWIPLVAGGGAAAWFSPRVQT